MMEGTASSEKRGNKKLELKEVEEGEDHISALPDSIIQHILSFLPSTKEAIRTSILSKRWKNQWSGVSSLIFDCTGMSDEQSLVFIYTTLIQHRYYNIEKFLIKLEGRIVDKDPLNEKIHFSIIRHVKELILEFLNCNIKLPQFLFNHTPLVKLRILGCAIVPNERINWECLKELNMINCMLPDDVVEGILSSCQLLELLGLSSCFGFSRLVVASNSLKEMELGNLPLSSVLEISCPKLEEFNLYGLLDVMTTSFKNLSSLIRAHLDFELEGEDHEGSLVKKVLEQFQHVEELTYGCQLFEAILSDLDGRPDLPPPLLKNKCLTLDSPSDAIEYALLSSPFLEKIVITKDFFLEFVGYHNPFLMRHRERYWRRDGSEFKCLVSHLKFVEVIDLPDTDRDYPFVLDFIGFLLKNSTVLEKLVVTLKGGGKAFETEVSEFLQSFQRCLTHAIIEVLGSQSAQFV